MSRDLNLLDISRPLLAAQKFKANQLTLKQGNQALDDRKTLRNIRQKMVTKNTLGTPELDQNFVIDPANAMAVASQASKIKAMNNPRTIIDELDKNKILRGFAMSSDKDSWEPNKQWLKKNGINTDGIGEYSEQAKTLLLGITGKIEQTGKQRIAELNAGVDQQGNQLSRKALVGGGQETQFLDKPGIKKFKPAVRQGAGEKLSLGDEKFFREKARNKLGSFMDENGRFNKLNPNAEREASDLEAIAGQFYYENRGEWSRADAWNAATQAARDNSGLNQDAGQQAQQDQRPQPPAGTSGAKISDWLRSQ